VERGLALEGVGDYTAPAHAHAAALVIGYASPPAHTYSAALARLVPVLSRVSPAVATVDLIARQPQRAKHAWRSPAASVLEHFPRDPGELAGAIIRLAA
jgi:hypothetical protein